MCEPQTQHTKWKKADAKHYILYNSIYIKRLKNKFIETENRSVVT